MYTCFDCHWNLVDGREKNHGHCSLLLRRLDHYDLYPLTSFLCNIYKKYSPQRRRRLAYFFLCIWQKILYPIPCGPSRNPPRFPPRPLNGWLLLPLQPPLWALPRPGPNSLNGGGGSPGTEAAVFPGKDIALVRLPSNNVPAGPARRWGGPLSNNGIIPGGGPLKLGPLPSGIPGWFINGGGIRIPLSSQNERSENNKFPAYKNIAYKHLRF